MMAGGAIALFGRLYVFPLLEGKAKEQLKSIFGVQTTRAPLSVSGEWSIKWWVEGEKESTLDGDENVKVRQTADHVTATYELSDGNYFLEGEIGNGRFLTGTWQSTYEGAVYYGAFQLHIEPNSEKMVGRWIGFGTDNTVKGGPFKMSKQSS